MGLNFYIRHKRFAEARATLETSLEGSSQHEPISELLNELERETRAVDAQWSYGGFAEFRRALAKEVGAAGSHAWSPLTPLLHHSDCDGEMSPKECAQVYPKLREIVEQWPGDDVYGHNRSNGLGLAAAMKHVADNPELELVFA